MNDATATEKDLAVLFGLDGLSEEEKADFLEEIGMTIVESAALRFILEADAEEAKRFEALIEREDAGFDQFKTALETFPRFGEILDEETAAFREEAFAILS